MLDGHEGSGLESATASKELCGARSGRRVVLDVTGSVDTLRIESPSGELELTVLLTADGPVLRVSGAHLQLAATRTLELSCETLAIHAASDVVIDVGGNVKETVAGTHSVVVGDASSLEARRVSVAARLGNAEIRANDDVRIDGERIWLNR